MEYYVNKIAWDRIWILFNVDFISESEDDIYLVNSDNTARFLLKKGSNPSEYKLNITNPGNCAMLPPGIYTLKSSCDLEGSDSKKQIQFSLLPSKDLDISNLNRQFIYFHKERSYRVQFSVKNGLKIKISDIRLKSSSHLSETPRINRSNPYFEQFIILNILNIIRRTINRDTLQIYFLCLIKANKWGQICQP